MNIRTINYNLSSGGDYPKWAKMEDNALMAEGRSIVDRLNMGKGGIAIAQVIFTDLMNYNYRRFMKDKIEQSVSTFYSPNFTPFLMHHDHDGYVAELPIGSNIYGKYIRRNVDTVNGTASGYAKVVTFISDKTKVGNISALDAIQSRQILGISQGSSVPRDNYQCSICKNSLMSADCEHSPGTVYDGVMCCIDTLSPFRFKEYSSVFAAAEVEATIRRMDMIDSENGTKDSLVVEYDSGPFHMEIFDSQKVFHIGATKDTQYRSDEMDIKQLQANIATLNDLIADYESLITTQSDTIKTIGVALADKVKTVDSLTKEIDKLKADTTDNSGTSTDGADDTSTSSTGTEEGSSTSDSTDGNTSESATDDNAGTSDSSPTDPPPAVKNYKDILLKNRQLKIEADNALNQLNLFV